MKKFLIRLLTTLVFLAVASYTIQFIWNGVWSDVYKISMGKAAALLLILDTISQYVLFGILQTLTWVKKDE